jgi:hypothetical protein
MKILETQRLPRRLVRRPDDLYALYCDEEIRCYFPIKADL